MVDLLKKDLIKEENTDNSIEKTTGNDIIYELDEEDRIVVALIASAMASEDNPNTDFRISKITRIN